VRQIAYLSRISSQTYTLHLSPRDIINAMTVFHGAMTGAEVDALRLPCFEEETIVRLRRVLAQLTIVHSVVYCSTRGHCATDVRGLRRVHHCLGTMNQHFVTLQTFIAFFTFRNIF
jgi:hypothetical protein